MKKNNRGTRLLLVLLVAALVAVVAYIILKQREYNQSDAFYNSLRGLAGLMM